MKFVRIRAKKKDLYKDLEDELKQNNHLLVITGSLVLAIIFLLIINFTVAGMPSDDTENQMQSAYENEQDQQPTGNLVVNGNTLSPNIQKETMSGEEHTLVGFFILVTIAFVFYAFRQVIR